MRTAPAVLFSRPVSARLLALLIALNLLSLGGPLRAEDRRLIWDGSHPAWLAAVGRLEVPSLRHDGGERRHYIENCSATLIGRPGQRVAQTVVTAWHCLEGYRDLSRDIRFILPGEGTALGALVAYPLSSGGSMADDWAILRLARKVPVEHVAPLQAVTLAGAVQSSTSSLAMAGYSRDDGRGAGGDRLTYDPGCHIRAAIDKNLETDCQAFRGASGGAVVELTPSGEPRYRGVISAGDSETVSRYVPVERFRSELDQALR